MKYAFTDLSWAYLLAYLLRYAVLKNSTLAQLRQLHEPRIDRMATAAQAGILG